MCSLLLPRFLIPAAFGSSSSPGMASSTRHVLPDLFVSHDGTTMQAVSLGAETSHTFLSLSLSLFLAYTQTPTSCCRIEPRRLTQRCFHLSVKECYKHQCVDPLCGVYKTLDHPQLLQQKVLSVKNHLLLTVKCVQP